MFVRAVFTWIREWFVIVFVVSCVLNYLCVSVFACLFKCVCVFCFCLMVWCCLVCVCLLLMIVFVCCCGLMSVLVRDIVGDAVCCLCDCGL